MIPGIILNRAHEPTPLCLPCAVADNAAQHRGDIPRPLNKSELEAAADACRDHPPRLAVVR